MPKPIRILTIADLHCGNRAGLTPPKYNQQSEVNYKEYCYRRSLWEWYEHEINKLKPIDICVVNGDCIDGKGPKNGSTELIYTARTTQIDMAKECIDFVGAKEYYFTYGTGYHTGPEDDWEYEVAQEFGGNIDDIVTLQPHGIVMKWRHHISGSQTPIGRATALLRMKLWDTLWAEHGEFLRASIQVFSHVHYFSLVENRDGMVMTTPALQGLGGSMLGSRRLGGIVDYGFVHFDILGKDEYSWQKHFLKQTPLVRSGQSQKSKLISKVLKKKGK